jgi:hypothetical protein
LSRGEYKVLKARSGIRRILISNGEVLSAVHYGRGEMGLRAANVGTSDLFVWFEDSQQAMVRYAVEVR